MILIWILLWVLLAVYVGGWIFSIVFLWLCDPKNKLAYLVIALGWPIVALDLVRGRNWSGWK